MQCRKGIKSNQQIPMASGLQTYQETSRKGGDLRTADSSPMHGLPDGGTLEGRTNEDHNRQSHQGGRRTKQAQSSEQAHTDTNQRKSNYQNVKKETRDVFIQTT